MSIEAEKIFKEYKNIKIPKSRRFITGPDETREIGHSTDDFFEHITSTLKLSQHAISTFFKVEHHEMRALSNNGRITSNNDIANLWLDGVQPLGSVMSVRDDANFQVVVFSKYSLLPMARETLLRIWEHDED